MKLNEMLLTVMSELNNFFIDTAEVGAYTIQNGVIELQGEYLPGQWIAITMTKLNNGVYRIREANNGAYTLENGSDDVIPTVDETGAKWGVYGLCIPPALITLTQEIISYNENEGKPTAYVSESVAGLHSWSKATGKDGAPLAWQDVYRKRLNRWRHMFNDIPL